MLSSATPTRRLSALHEASLALARCRTKGEMLACIKSSLDKLVHLPVQDVVWRGGGEELSLLTNRATFRVPSTFGRTQMAEGQIVVEDGISYVPLAAQNRLQGWVAIETTEPLDLSLAVWGTHCASALLAVEAATDHRERVVIDQIAQVLSSTLQLDTVLEKIATMVGELVDAQGFYIALIDDDSRQFSFAYINVPGGQPAESELTWPVDEGLSGLVVRTGEPICADDYVTECARRGIEPSAPAGTHYVKAWLGVPLRHQDQILGVMVVTHDDPRVRFGTRDVQLLATVAAQAAAAVANAQLYARTQQQAGRLALINRIGRTIASTLDPQAVPMLLVNELTSVLDVEAVFVLIADGDKDALEVRYAQPDFGLIGHTVPADTGIAHRALEQHEVVIEYEVPPDRLFYTPPHGTSPSYSVLCAPLLGRRIKGVIAIHNKRSGRFTQADIEFVSAIAEQAAIALDNAQLHGQTDEALAMHIRDLEQRNHQLAEVVKIGNALRSTFSVEQLASQITQTIYSMTSASHIILALVEPELPYLRCVTVMAFGAGSAMEHEQWLTLAEFEELLSRGQPIGTFTHHISHDPLLPGFRDAAIMAIRQRREGLVGAIVLEVGDGVSPLSPDLVRALEIVANQAGTALHNARLYTEQQKTVDRLTALNALSLAVSTAHLAVEDVMNMAIAGAIGTTGGVAGGASVVFEGRTITYYGTRLSDADDATYIQSLPADESDYIELGAEQIPASIADKGIGKMLLVPLRGAKLRVGTLWVGYAQGVLPQAEREMAVLYAKMAGAVIESMYLAEAVQSAHDRMVSILSSTREGMLLVGEDQQIALANRAFSQLLGIEGRQLQGLTIDAFCAGDALAHLPQELCRPLCDALTTTMAGSTEVAEGEMQVPDGTERELTWQVLPVRAARSSGKAALLVVRDVTTDRQMERLRQDLANMLVHDLRSPLTNMMVSVDLLLKRATGPLTDAQVRILTIASSSCQQMLDLVNALLDIRRLEQRTRELERHPVNITSIAETVLERLERMAQDRRVHLSMDAAPVPQLEGDPDMLRRVLQNLVDNAIKFSPPGETVTVRSYTRNAEDLGRGHAPDGWVVVEVEDHGIGIAEEYHEVIFELFGQTPEGHGRGTGLGLAFCKLAIEAHGGKIWLRSAPGQGSSFFVSLPVSQ